MGCRGRAWWEAGGQRGGRLWDAEEYRVMLSQASRKAC